MQTASEFVEKQLVAIPGYRAPWAVVTVSDVEARDREVRLDERIKTLKEAARLVCHECQRGLPAVERECDTQRRRMHVWDIGGHPTLCDAESINRRIAELEAEGDGG